MPTEYQIAFWNVENLFDFWEPHPSDPDMPTVDEYNKLLEKVASTIRLAGAPAIIGLQEVENVGVLEDLAANTLLDGFDYQPVLLEGTDSRGIDVGYLVRGGVVIKDVQQLPAPEELTPRPPLLLDIEIEVGASSQTLYLINNHFLSMSGGEKARLVLCMLVWQRPNLLLLDEPTNHLDLNTREALAVALNEFEGTVMLVSHDRALLRSVCDEFWLVSKGGVAPFDGDLEDYQRYLLDEAKRSREQAAAEQKRAA